MPDFSREFYEKLLEEITSFCKQFDESDQTLYDICTLMKSLDIHFYREYIGSAIEILDEAAVLYGTNESNRSLSEVEIEEFREKSEIITSAARIMIDSYSDILEDKIRAHKET